MFMKLAVLVFLAAGVGLSQPTKIETCSDFKRLGEIDGSTVMVAGEYTSGFESEALRADCPGLLELDGQSWTWAIQPDWSSTAGTIALGKLRRYCPPLQSCRLRIRLVGTIHSYRSTPSYTDKLGRQRWAGFRNVFPARIDVEDLVIEN
jgi:hypothetical protein